MDLCVTPRAEHQLFQRESLSSSDLHSLWRLESGALRVDSQGEDGNSEFVRLALPGDLVGVETLAGVTDNLTVRALTPARLRPVDLVDKNHLTQILMETLSRVHQRCREVASLRTGSTTVRLQRLLRMLSGDKHTVSALPTLSDMAAIINAAPETVCRVMTSLREIEVLKELKETDSENTKHRRLESRAHQIKTSIPARVPALRTRMAG